MANLRELVEASASLVFDIDGTLVDSFAVNEEASAGFVQGLVTDGLFFGDVEELRKASIHNSSCHMADFFLEGKITASEVTRRYVAAYHAARTKPRVYECSIPTICLGRARGKIVASMTAASEPIAHVNIALLQRAYDLSGGDGMVFDGYVHSGEGLPDKRDPCAFQRLLHALPNVLQERMNSLPKVFIGDSETDAIAASNMGASFVYIGGEKPDPLLADRSAVTVRSIREFYDGIRS